MPDNESLSEECGKLKDLDDLLKCGICYEYLKTTLITPCSHNYCSYCIRQSLLYRNQCPACFEDTNESQLRNNRVVDEIILIYAAIKETLLKYLGHLPNIKMDSGSGEVNQEPPLKQNADNFIVEQDTKQPVPQNNSNYEVAPTKNVPTTSKKEVRIPAMFSPKKKFSNVNEVKVPCPVCSVEIPEKNINFHLDACLKRSQEKRVIHNEKRKPLAKLVYNLIPDKELRKKLGDLGLSTNGDRKTLINRHKRYTLLYNSECDSLSPKSITEIIKQLKKEEEEEKKVSTQVVKKLSVDRKADPKVNEEAQRQYLQEHKSSFQRLIEEARRNQNAKRNISKTQEEESNIITLEESSSETSENEFRITRPAHKRKIITSDSEGETNEDDMNGMVTQASIHSCESRPEEARGNVKFSKKVSNKEIEGTLKCSAVSAGPKLLSEPLDMYDNSTDEIVSVKGDDETMKDIIQEVSTKHSKLKTLESDHPLHPSTSSNITVSVTSPVLGTKCRQTRTPTNAHRKIESFKRDLTPGLLHEKTSTSSPTFIGASAGCGLEEDVMDSDSSSNHSTSLMMYTGPDCDYDLEQNTPKTTPSKSNPAHSTTPAAEKSCFDLGIEEILQNTEDFIPTPVRRQSRRKKTSQKITPVIESSSRGLRKRVRIDDL